MSKGIAHCVASALSWTPEGLPSEQRCRPKKNVRFSLSASLVAYEVKVSAVKENSAPNRRVGFTETREVIGTLSLLFRYGENSGDPAHAEAHVRTSSHYQIS